jgi:hypothetical protein
MTDTKEGHSALFLAVDMFTGYIQLRPLKSRRAEAVKTHRNFPFGILKYFHCNNESAMANSVEFHIITEPLGVQFL